MKMFYPHFEAKISQEPSHIWLEGWLSRVNCRCTTGHNIIHEYAEQGTVENIKNWFVNVFLKMNPQNYQRSMIYNMDETMVVSNNRIPVIIRKTDKFAPVMEDNKSEHITLACTISSNGDLLTPFIITQLHYLPSTLNDLIKDQKLTLSGNSKGWMNGELFLEWTKWFVKENKQRKQRFELPENERSLLLLDSHSSRENVEALKILKDNFVDVITYPSHCTFLVQALDVGIFKSFK